MKKATLALATALFVGSLAMGSCKGKKDEPVNPPTPVNPVNPVNPITPIVPSTDPNNPGTDNMPAVQTPSTLGFRLEGGNVTMSIKGENVVIDGLDAGQTINTTGAPTTYTVSGTNPVVYIKGGVTEMSIFSPLKAINLSKAPATLTSFTAKGRKTTDLDLSGAVNLEKLAIDSLQTPKVDLSKNTKLKNVTFGSWSTQGGKAIEEIVWPSPSALEVIELASAGIKTFDFAAHPKLKDFRGGGQNGLTELNVTNHSELQRIFLPKVSSFKKLVVKNAPKLVTIVLVESSIEHLEIDGAPKLTEPSGSGWNGLRGFWFKDTPTGPEKNPRVFTITNSGITRP